MYVDSNHTKGGKVPSTNKLSSRITRSVAKFLLSFCGLASFGVVTTLFALSSNTVYAESNSNTITANLPGSVAIRLLDSTGTTEISSLDFNNLTPTPQGTTASKSFIVDVATSNPTGYKLYMQSDYQDSNSNYTTNLTHTDSDVTDSIPTLVPGSGSSADSKVYWNYVNPLTSTGSSNPTPSVIPPYGTPDRIAQGLEPTNSDQTEVAINVGIDTTIVSGTYENQLLFSAVGNTNPLTYTLNLDAGTGTIVEDTVTEQAAASVHTMTIPNDTANYLPVGTNGLFTYWEIEDPTTASCSRNSNNTTNGNNNNNNNDTSICYPGDRITIEATIDSQGEVVGEAKLIAHYVSISTMQAMVPNICTVAYTGASTTLTDTRDTKTYTIRKLKDNNCWMTQSLDFLPTAGTTISSATSNVALATTLQTTDSTKSNYLTDDCSDANIDKYCIAYSNNAEHPEYGTYYNWYAATSGTGTSTMVSPDRATSSICPKGWRLPTSGEGGEFQVLYNNYNSWESMTDSSGSQFVLGGYRYGTSPDYQGTYGLYWSSSAYTNATRAYRLSLNGTNSRVNPAGDGGKRLGSSLRCLAHDNSYSILGVDPNGGTWSGSTNSQTFAEAPETPQTISNPTANATYSISYDMGSTGIATPSSPTSATRAFTGWTASLGEGATFVPASGLYTYGTGNSSLVAQYNTTSNSFNLPTLSKSGYNCAWHQGSASGAVKQNDVTISSDTKFYAVCTAINYTINLSGSNVSVTNTSGTDISSISVPYGGSATFKITPASGYYLSSHTCASLTGYSCSNISTGTSATGTQTVTITNNNSTNTGTLVFTGTVARTPLQQACDNATIGGTFTYGGIQYIKLKTNSAGTTSACYTKSSQGTATWANASSLCPSGTGVPSADQRNGDFDKLVSAYGPDGALYTATGWSGFYWSSTSLNKTYAYYLNVDSSRARVYNDTFKSHSYSVICIVR